MNRGFFFAPTVLGHVPDQARIMSEEPFAPIAAASSTFQELRRGDRAGRTAVPYGLAGYVSFLLAGRRPTGAAEALEVGMVGRQRSLFVSSAEAPFGGVKDLRVWPRTISSSLRH